MTAGLQKLKPDVGYRRAQGGSIAAAREAQLVLGPRVLPAIEVGNTMPDASQVLSPDARCWATRSPRR